MKRRQRKSRETGREKERESEREREGAKQIQKGIKRKETDLWEAGELSALTKQNQQSCCSSAASSFVIPLWCTHIGQWSCDTSTKYMVETQTHSSVHLYTHMYELAFPKCHSILHILFIHLANFCAMLMWLQFFSVILLQNQPYSLNNRQMGLAVIVNNVANEQPGSVVDTQALSQAYRTLGFQVQLKENCSKKVRTNWIFNPLFVLLGHAWICSKGTHSHNIRSHLFVQIWQLSIESQVTQVSLTHSLTHWLLVPFWELLEAWTPWWSINSLCQNPGSILTGTTNFKANFHFHFTWQPEERDQREQKVFSLQASTFYQIISHRIWRICLTRLSCRNLHMWKATCSF